MFERLLLYLDDRQETAPAIALALQMARVCDARLFAAWVLPGAANPALPRRPGKRIAQATDAAEEYAWRRLYEIEDDAFEHNVKISLLLETGNRDERLLALIDSYQLDALIIGTRAPAGWENLIAHAPVTVILAR